MQVSVEAGLALILCLVLLSYDCIYNRKWLPLVIYLGSFLIAAFAVIAPLTRYNFGYWFNHGQPPHTARFSVFEIVDEFFISSQWIKFYLFIIVLLAIAHYKSWKAILTDKRSTVFLLLVLGILAQAAVLQITSYTPPDNNIFFHSFAFVFILSFLAKFLQLDFSRIKTLSVAALGLLLTWSGVYWKYFQRIAEKILPDTGIKSATNENIVNRRTYVIHTDSTEIPMSEWTFTRLRTFEKIYMPKPTVDGIHRLLDLDLVKNNKNLSALNHLIYTSITPFVSPLRGAKKESIL